MLRRTIDGLRGICITSHYNGSEYRIHIIKYRTGEPGETPVSAHHFGTYGHPGSAMSAWPSIIETALRIQRELATRAECDGVLNWETASMGLEIIHDGQNYADRLKMFKRVTKAGHIITAANAREFAERHGYLKNKETAFLELVDWVDLAHWLESERQEAASTMPEVN